MILKSIRISRIRLEEGLVLFAWIFLAMTGGGRSLYSFLPASMLALISCWFLLRDRQIKCSSINSPLFCFIGWLLFSILMSQNKFVSALTGLKLFSAIIVFQVFLTHREGKLEEIFWVFVSIFSLVNAVSIFWKDVAWGILPPNANYCAILMAAGSVWLFSKARQAGSWEGSILCLCGVFLFFAVLRTSSRTGLLFFALAFLTAIVKDGWLLRKKWLLFTIPVIIVLILSPRYVRNEILKINNPFKNILKMNDPLIGARVDIWKTSLSVVRAYPAWGTGPGLFEDGYRRFNFPVKKAWARYDRLTQFAHNEYLQVASEMGVVSLVYLLWGIIVFFRTGKGLFEKGIVGGFLFVSFFDFTLHLPANAWIFSAVAGKALRESSYKTIRMPRIASHFCSASIILILVFCLQSILGFMLMDHQKGDLAVKVNPWNSRVWFKRSEESFIGAVSIGSREVWKEVEENYHRLLSLNPGNGLAHFRLGQIYAVQYNQFLLAARHFEESIRLSPYHAPWILELGKVYLNEDDPQTASRVFRKAVSHEPRYFQANLLLSISMESQGKFVEAEKNLRDMLLPTPPASLKKTHSNYEKAILEEDWASFHKVYGRILTKMGKYSEAEHHLKRAVSMAPLNHEPLSVMAGVLYYQKRYHEAETLIKKAIRLAPSIQDYKKNLDRIHLKLRDMP